MDRRRFLTTAALAAGATLTTRLDAIETAAKVALAETQSPGKTGGKKPILVSSANGWNGSEAGYKILADGGDPLDALLVLLKTQEDDPLDDSVGLGGLPNEEGVTELDACVMHGPTRRAGSVAGVRNIKNVCLVARKVMERSNHVMLVGEGAERFAVAHGFPRENLLTEASRKVWLLWKEMHSNADDWGPGISDPNWKPPVPVPTEKPKMLSRVESQIDSQSNQRTDLHTMFRSMSPEDQKQKLAHMYQVAAELGIPEDFRDKAIHRVLFPPTGTIHCSALNAKGEMAGATTTSGLAWKLPGRAGDSPIIGAGNFCDQDVGSAGATGTGEENIKVAGAHTIVENMRHGMTPLEAGMDALKRIARNHANPDKLRFLSMKYYILRKDGAYAGVSLWGDAKNPPKFQVNDGTRRMENLAYLFEGSALDWPPVYQ